MPYLDLHVHISDVVEVGNVLAEYFDTTEDYERNITRRDSLKSKSSSLTGNVIYADVYDVKKYLTSNKIPFWLCEYESDFHDTGDICKCWYDGNTYHKGEWDEDSNHVNSFDLFHLKNDIGRLIAFVNEQTFQHELPDFIEQKKLQARAKTTTLLLNQS